MKVNVNKFCGKFPDGTRYKINWRTEKDDLIIELSTYSDKIKSYVYETGMVKIFTPETYKSVLRSLLEDASRDWGIQLIKEYELKKTA